ncbi:hypothetical protein DSM104299_03485 [Baekduia alba]|uniref:hypothetical protein n=1 Tax=Baekduia alba TaxID=2997333 RepID=UPI0023423755|nr:hypothetical protein [Baekduia alba]WCB94746.1 hypothetical protein DSM104299_03485 [Baekduia alba]
MEKTEAGDLVKVATGRRETDGIVFDVPSGAKAIVAVVDRDRGPVMRTVELKDLTEREEAGPDDTALQMLIRRTPGGVRGAARAGSGPGQARAGHRRAAMHRTTGK